MVEHAGSVDWAFVSLSMHWLLAGKCSTLISVSRSASSCKLQGSVHVQEHVTKYWQYTGIYLEHVGSSTQVESKSLDSGR